MRRIKRLGGAPNLKQLQFFKARAKHVAYGGARGGGKSWAMRRKFIMLALRYPGLRLLLLRRTLPELRENHLLPLMSELQGVAAYTERDRVFTFPNGSRIKLGYCGHERDVFQYQGQEYDVIGLEEATHFTEAQMQFLTTCNRSTRTDFTPRMYYTCNPGNVGHAWVKRLFVTRAYEGCERPEDYQFVQARVFDNTALLRSQPDYVRTLENLPEDLRRAHLEGDWQVLAGQFFREFREHAHVVAPFDIPAWWRRFRSIDWGYNDPCCVLWHAVDGDGRIFTYREMYVRRTNAGDVAREVVARSKGETIAATYASPDMWHKRGGILASEGGMAGEHIAELFMKAGVPLLPADNARVAGWQRIREYMALAPDGVPYWQAFDTCRNLIRTLPELLYDEHNSEDVSGACEDHAAEALRYGLMSRPRKAAKPRVYVPRPIDPLG